MPIANVDPRRFVGKPLFLQPYGDLSYLVMIDGLKAGSIQRVTRSYGAHVWQWTLGSPCAPVVEFPSYGDEPTLAAANKAFRAKFDLWLQAALNRSEWASWYH